MKKFVRKIISQRAINLFYHLPKAVLANIVYGFPSKRLKVIGVTGTDGKTTTTNMIYKILVDADKKAAMVSTINARIGKESIDTGFHVTSPNSFLVQRLLKKAADRGMEYMVLETTSHALDQFRYWGINFNVGVITNVTHEHLDYHKTFQRYLDTKAKLIKKVQWAILNKDDKNFTYLSQKTSGKIVRFGLKKADVDLQNFPLKLKIPGEYNLSNALAAAAVTQVLGIDPKAIKKSLESFSNLEGRMEEIKNGRGVRIFIDFAHTPNGLENALKTLREIRGRKKIISIIGAEGYRDIEKRPLMGEIAARLSDKVIITAVDPRGMLPKINQQILKGVKRGSLGKDIFVIDDRKEAIGYAINTLSKRGDVIGIFGKGHETSMNLDGTHEILWSDKKAVEKILYGK